jgi:hypothetical protein
MNNKNIDDILNSINGLQSATPKPYLGTRVAATIANNKNAAQKKPLLQWLLQPVVASAIVVVVIMLNLLVLQQDSTNNNETEMEDFIANNDVTETTTNLWNENNLNK